MICEFCAQEADDAKRNGPQMHRAYRQWNRGELRPEYRRGHGACQGCDCRHKEVREDTSGGVHQGGTQVP